MNLPQRANLIADQLKAEKANNTIRVINLPLVRERVAMGSDGLSELEIEELTAMVLKRVSGS